MEWTADRIRAARVRSLLLDDAEARSPLEIAQWHGAMQAQDAASGHWSLGVRSRGLRESDVLASFERGDIVRTWPMRGTIHIVPGEDVTWLLDLTSARSISASARRRGELGLADAMVNKAAAVLADAVAGRRCITRAEAFAVLDDAGLEVSAQRGYHMLWYASQVGAICIGPQRGTDQTFVSIGDWAPPQIRRSREDALATLLFRFVRSHGPVPLRDFAGWTGLTLGDARAAARANDGRIRALPSEHGEMFATHELMESMLASPPPAHAVLTLPGYDEFMLGYKERSLQVPPGAMEQIVPGNNGIFRATVIAKGQVIGTWARSMRADRVLVDLTMLRSLNGRERTQLTAALERYAAFVERRLVVKSAE